MARFIGMSFDPGRCQTAVVGPGSFVFDRDEDCSTVVGPGSSVFYRDEDYSTPVLRPVLGLQCR